MARDEKRTNYSISIKEPFVLTVLLIILNLTNGGGGEKNIIIYL
jgi:hypothetical protein